MVGPFSQKKFHKVICLPQVEEAVAVLQAHQAKKEAAQKVGVVAATS